MAAKKTTDKSSIKQKDLDALVDLAWSAFEETLDGVEGDPAKLLAAPKLKASTGMRGLFTESVQSIYAGAIDKKEATRMIEQELAPFVDGPALAIALRNTAPDDNHSWLGDLVDQFVIRAIDDLALALLALALDRPDDVPATCDSFASTLGRRVDAARALLDG